MCAANVLVLRLVGLDMLEATTRIYVRDPEREDNLIPGVVSEVLGQKVMVRFLQPVSFKPGAATMVQFHDQNNSFTSVPCQMQRMFSSGQYPTGALVLTGDKKVAESRSAFRVDVHDESVSAVINQTERGEVVNVSCGGIGVRLNSDEHEPEQWLKVKLQFDCEEFAGKMQVRGKFQEKDGRLRYGLLVDESDTTMVSQLSRITQELQSQKARRASRIGVNNKIKSAEPKSTPPQQADAKSEDSQAKQEEKAPSPDGTQRQHQRNPWPGMAKIYIREEHNLRVLSVDCEDLSRGGISFLCPQYIYEGSEVLFEKPISGGFFRVMVAVRNVRVQEGGTHRIGGQFLGAPMQPGKMPEGFNIESEAA